MKRARQSTSSEHKNVWKDECVIPLPGSGSIRCDAFPHDVSYVRVVDARGHEIGHWTIDEVEEDPVDVLGAILGAAKQLTESAK
jgi:hypothetical protein